MSSPGGRSLRKLAMTGKQADRHASLAMTGKKADRHASLAMTKKRESTSQACDDGK